MSLKTIRHSWFARFSLGLAILGLGLLFVFMKPRAKTFPPLPTGSFVGRISGVSSPLNKYKTFYVERSSSSSSLLVAVMSRGWRPQLTNLKRALGSVANKDALTENIPFEPPELVNGGKKFFLSGAPYGTRYRGELKTDTGGEGRWELKKVTIPEYNDLENFDLQKWLLVKRNELSVKRRFEVAKKSAREGQSKLVRFRDFISDTTKLKQKAEEKKEALASELQIAEQKKQEISSEVHGLVSELGLLSRLRKRGKAVSIARKVALRESKWYLANWRATEDESGLGEFLGARSNLNLPQLNYEVRRAKENQLLLKQILEEKSKIAKIQAQLRSENNQDTLNNINATYDSNRNKKRNKHFWNHIWGKGSNE